MKTKKWTIIFLLFTGIILFAGQSAFGGCEVGALDQYVDDKAPGTRYKGTLAFYYDDELQIVYIFARIVIKKTPYAFAGKIENVESVADFLNDPTLVSAFFTDNVIPYLYNCDPGSCPDVALKSYSDDVARDNPGCVDYTVCEAYEFYILDFVIAVNDK
jgi:hypothetical protein